MKNKLKIFAAFILLVCCMHVSVNAIVNTETFQTSGRPGIQSFLSVQTQFHSGNTNYVALEPASTLHFIPKNGKWRGFLRASLAYAKHENVEIQDRHFIHARLVESLGKKLEREYFLQQQSNEFILLQRRYLAGITYRKYVLTGKHTLITSSGLMYEHESLYTQYHTRVLRSSSYFIYKYQLSDMATFNSVTYIQPKIDMFADFRILSELNIISKITKFISLSVNIEARYDSRPMDSVDHLDIYVSQSLHIEI